MTMELQRERDAWFTIRGYVYQVDVTIDRWLDLGPRHVLELERGEDIDLVGRAAAARGAERKRLLEQVKHLQSGITLRSTPARAFLANACAHQSANPSASLVFRFTTTAAVARERSTPMPGGSSGIEVWEQLRTGALPEPERDAALAALRHLLASRTPPGELPAPVWRGFQDFLARCSDGEMMAFIQACEWACGGVPADWYAERLRHRLTDLGYAPDERRAASLYDRLFAHVFRTLTRSGLKSLSHADLEAQGRPAFRGGPAAGGAGPRTCAGAGRARAGAGVDDGRGRVGGGGAEGGDGRLGGKAGSPGPAARAAGGATVPQQRPPAQRCTVRGP